MDKLPPAPLQQQEPAPHTAASLGAQILKPPSREPSDLPAGWIAQADPASGKTFYYHDHTRKSTWIRPEGAAAASVALNSLYSGEHKEHWVTASTAGQLPKQPNVTHEQYIEDRRRYLDELTRHEKTLPQTRRKAEGCVCSGGNCTGDSCCSGADAEGVAICFCCPCLCIAACFSSS